MPKRPRTEDANPPAPPRKTQTNMRLSPEGRRIMRELATRWGISQADVIEIVLRSVEELTEGIDEHALAPRINVDPKRLPLSARKNR